MQHHSLRLSFSPLNCLCNLVENELSLYMWAHIWTVNFVSLIVGCVEVNIALLDHCCFLISLRIKKCQFTEFIIIFQRCFGILRTFPYEFQNQLLYLSLFWEYDWDYIESIHQYVTNWHPNSVGFSASAHWHFVSHNSLLWEQFRVRQGVQQPSWPSPTRVQQHNLPLSYGKSNMSLDLLRCPQGWTTG